MQNCVDATLCRGDCRPLNGITCLGCQKAQPNAVYLYCQSCIHSGAAILETQAPPGVEPELQALKHALRKRKAHFDMEEGSLERSNCEPLGNICCLSCNEAQRQPVYVYCQGCLNHGMSVASTRSLDLELQALKEVLLRKKAECGA